MNLVRRAGTMIRKPAVAAVLDLTNYKVFELSQATQRPWRFGAFLGLPVGN